MSTSIHVTNLSSAASTSGTSKTPEKYNPDKGMSSVTQDLYDNTLTSGNQKTPETVNPDRSTMCQSTLSNSLSHTATSGISNILEKSNPDNSNKSNNLQLPPTLLHLN
jgi:hypothetical protein